MRLAIPGSYDQMTVFISTQNPNGDQAPIARALGVRANQVTVRVEQIGGGFGGKQHRAVLHRRRGGRGGPEAEPAGPPRSTTGRPTRRWSASGTRTSATTTSPIDDDGTLIGG